MFSSVLSFLASLSFSLMVGAAEPPASGQPVQLQPTSGETKFVAIGRPSMLKINGQGQGPGGQLTANGQQLSGRFEVDLSTLATGFETRDQHMKEKYLEVGKYRTATLTIEPLKLPVPFTELATSANKKGDTPFTGTLDLHGTKGKVEGKVHWEGAPTGEVAIAANFTLKLSDYKINIPTYAGIKVADNVDVNVTSKIPSAKR